MVAQDPNQDRIPDSVTAGLGQVSSVVKNDIKSTQETATSTTGTAGATTATTAAAVAATTQANEAPADTVEETGTEDAGTETDDQDTTADDAAEDGSEDQADADSAAAATSTSNTDPLANASAATALTDPTSTGSTSSSSDTTSDPSLQQSSTNGSSGGMSSGTKIGIGVGVGIGAALLLAALAFFLIMRRRRRNSRGYPSSDSQNMQQMRHAPGMVSTEPALGGAAAPGRSPSFRSLTGNSSYHSLSPGGAVPEPHTAALGDGGVSPVGRVSGEREIGHDRDVETLPEAGQAAAPALPTIFPPSRSQEFPAASPSVETPRGRRSMEAEIFSPVAESVFSDPPAYESAPGSIRSGSRRERDVSPVSPVSSMGSRPPSFMRGD